MSESIDTPIAASFSFATCASISAGTTNTSFGRVAACFARCSTDSDWLANDMSITEAGWPSAAARLMSRPSPSRKIRLSPTAYSSTNGRVSRLPEDIFASAGMSISTLKCPELQTRAPSFMTRKCSPRITFLLPVMVMNRSPRPEALSMVTTSKPSIAASIALTGLISVTSTMAPMPRARMATPRPHQP